MKLFLDPKQEIPAYISKTDMHEQLKKSKKNAEAAVADYLTEMFKHARNMLVRRYGEYFISTTKISVVLTVPAVWSDAAKDATLRAAQQAGSAAKFSMAKQLTLISEPEAAAVYTLQAIQPNLLKVGNHDCAISPGLLTSLQHR
jgi:molecular chaperone DnaK (HSP70)